jgi:hypothetical protein
MIKQIFGIACAITFLTPAAHAQTTIGTPPISVAPTAAEATGTIKEYTPGSVLVIETLTPNAPLQFKLSKNITYADPDGKVIESAGLTTNQKVLVHYTKIGGDNLADKVTIIGN